MKTSTKAVAMRDAFGQALLDLAAEIPELVVLDADVSASTKTAGSPSIVWIASSGTPSTSRGFPRASSAPRTNMFGLSARPGFASSTRTLMVRSFSSTTSPTRVTRPSKIRSP